MDDQNFNKNNFSSEQPKMEDLKNNENIGNINVEDLQIVNSVQLEHEKIKKRSKKKNSKKNWSDLRPWNPYNYVKTDPSTELKFQKLTETILNRIKEVTLNRKLKSYTYFQDTEFILNLNKENEYDFIPILQGLKLEDEIDLEELIEEINKSQTNFLEINDILESLKFLEKPMKKFDEFIRNMDKETFQKCFDKYIEKQKLNHSNISKENLKDNFTNFEAKSSKSLIKDDLFEIAKNIKKEKYLNIFNSLEISKESLLDNIFKVFLSIDENNVDNVNFYLKCVILILNEQEISF